ncbi:MAG: hypothetical protein RO257_09670 [Candidatus Kapabacteria bacterium]|nr:hypothetical protein [Candidatus Kapabacteria bacterium]
MKALPDEKFRITSREISETKKKFFNIKFFLQDIKKSITFEALPKCRTEKRKVFENKTCTVKKIVLLLKPCRKAGKTKDVH